MVKSPVVGLTWLLFIGVSPVVDPVIMGTVPYKSSKKMQMFLYLLVNHILVDCTLESFQVNHISV